MGQVTHLCQPLDECQHTTCRRLTTLAFKQGMKNRGDPGKETGAGQGGSSMNPLFY